MLLLRFLLGSVLIGAIFANMRKKLEKCMEDVHLDMMEELANIPNNQELEVLCPVVLGYLDCVDNVFMKQFGMKLVDLATEITDPNIKKVARLFVNFQNIFSDLCRNDSVLHAAYEEHGLCWSTFNVDADVCTENALQAYDTYKASEDVINEEGSENSKEKQCLMEAYKSACIASQVHDHCGQGAFQFYQQIVKRTSIFSLFLCSEENLETLKTNFLSSLELDEDHQNLFRLAFDLKKKRR